MPRQQTALDHVETELSEQRKCTTRQLSNSTGYPGEQEMITDLSTSCDKRRSCMHSAMEIATSVNADIEKANRTGHY